MPSCLGCGGVLPGQARKWCSGGCRQRFLHRHGLRKERPSLGIRSFICRRCGSVFLSPHKRAFCTVKCYRRARYVPVRFIYSCRLCSRLFSTNQSLQKWCQSCRAEGHRQASYTRHLNRPHLRTAERLAILGRDGWRCRICGQAIDRTLPARHPMAATVDHIVPWSAGGAHTEENMQSAHLCCNSAKGTKVA
jgi:hypothetical protein